MLEHPTPTLWSWLLLPTDSEVAGQPVLSNIFPITCLSSDSTWLHLALQLIVPVPGYKAPASVFCALSDGPVLWCCPLLLFWCDDFGQVCLPFTNWTQKSKWLFWCAGYFLFPQPPFSVSYIICISNLVLWVIYWAFLIAKLYYSFELYWFPSSSFYVSSTALTAMSNRIPRSIPLYTIFPGVSTHVHLLYPPQAFICQAHLILLKKVFPLRLIKLKLFLFIRWAQQFIISEGRNFLSWPTCHWRETWEKGRQPDALEESGWFYKSFSGVCGTPAAPRSATDPVFSHCLWMFAGRTNRLENIKIINLCFPSSPCESQQLVQSAGLRWWRVFKIGNLCLSIMTVPAN